MNNDPYINDPEIKIHNISRHVDPYINNPEVSIHTQIIPSFMMDSMLINYITEVWFQLSHFFRVCITGWLYMQKWLSSKKELRFMSNIHVLSQRSIDYNSLFTFAAYKKNTGPISFWTKNSTEKKEETFSFGKKINSDKKGPYLCSKKVSRC